jgi:3-dehydroquinate synthase
MVIDKNVWRLHQSYLKKALPRSAEILLLTGSERSKCERQLGRIWRWLQDLETDRSSVLIAIGGGVTSDLAGLAAAAYMRAIDLILVPTTLLAQVDAAIGGKTAINLQSTKNIIGVFHPASLVVCDRRFLPTLSQAQVGEGLIEAIKVFAALDAGAFRCYRKVLADLSAERLPERLIADAIRLKCEAVERDPLDSGWRRVLNLGHTTGHAYELLTGSTHGEGVAYGMLVAIELSQRLLKLSPKSAESLVQAIRQVYPSFRDSRIASSRLWAKVALDKKRSGKQFNFVLLSALGRHKVRAVTFAQFKRAVEETNKRI